MSAFHNLIREIHRRSLWQVLGVYAVASWIIYQIVMALWEGIGLPSWVPGAALVLLLVGLPIVLATAFVQEGGPGGDGSASDAPTLAGLESTTDAVKARSERGGARAPAAAGPATDAPESSGATGDPRRRERLFTWSKAITGGVLAFAVLGLASAGFMGMRALGIGPAATLISSGELSERDGIVLADFESLTGDTVLSRVITEAFRADLAQSTAIELATDNEVGFVLERMGEPGRAVLTAELARQVATRGGMKALIAGDIGRLGGRYVLSARIVGALDGEVLATFRETATDSTELVSAVDRLAKSVREKVGESLRSIRQSPYLMAITTPSLPALKKLVQAQAAANRGDEPRALDLLDEAIGLDPEFSEAHRKRGAILFNRGRVTEALDAFQTALRRPDRLTDYERYHTRALVAEVQGNSADAIAEYQALLEIDSTDTRALNNMGVTYSLNGQGDRAVDAYERAVAVLEADSTQPVFPGTYLGLATSLWNHGLQDSARAAVRRLEERNPALGVWVGRSQFAGAEGNYDEAVAHARTILERFPASRDAPIFGRFAITMIHAVRGQVADAVTESHVMIREADAAGELGRPLVARIRVALVQASVLGDTAAALESLRAARAAVPLDSLMDPPLAALAVAYAEAGQVDSARAVARRLRDRPDWFLRGQPYLVPAVDAAIARAVGDHEAAAAAWAEADAAMQWCSVCFKAQLGLAEEGRGEPAAAIRAYEAYLETPYHGRLGWGRRGWMPMFDGDFLYRALVLERLAGLHEQAGNRSAAARYYGELVELWSDADPALQPRVESARRALARLAGEG